MRDAISTESMRLLESFHTRNLAAAQLLLPEGINLDISPIGNLEHTASCSVNIESPALLGNLTMWVTGECDLLVTNETAQDVLINETKVLKTESDVQRCLDAAYQRLRDINNDAS